MNNLKKLRKQKGFSQLQLADFLHISPSTVALWEIGEKTAQLGQLLALCNVLDCSIADLFLSDEYNNSCNRSAVPVFSTGVQLTVNFVYPSENNQLSHRYFGVEIPHDLSPRICQGDICYFETGCRYNTGDVVIALDADSNAEIFIADYANTHNKNIVAVSRYLQSRF